MEHLSEDIALARAWAAREQHGITRVANVTTLDRVGIQCVNTSRPRAARGNLTVSAGKGRTLKAAALRSLMECYERYYSEFPHAQVERVSDIRQDSRQHLDIRSLNPNLEALKSLDASVQVGWVLGRSIYSDEEIWVPDAAVYTPCDLPGASLFGGASHGLAAGFDDVSTIARALLELIERDAYSIGLLNHTGFEILMESIPDRQLELVEMLESAHISVRLFELWSDLSIPAYFAIGIDEEAPHSLLVAGGVAAATSSADAIEAALLELAQSRVSIISGAREDFGAVDWTRRSSTSFVKTVQRAREWMDGWPRIEYINRGESNSSNLFESVVGILRDGGFRNVVSVQLSPPDSEIKVYRALIPEIEVCGYDSYRVGPRMVRARLGRLDRNYA